jgi:hypothetical protein
MRYEVPVEVNVENRRGYCESSYLYFIGTHCLHNQGKK